MSSTPAIHAPSALFFTSTFVSSRTLTENRYVPLAGRVNVVVEPGLQTHVHEK